MKALTKVSRVWRGLRERIASGPAEADGVEAASPAAPAPEVNLEGPGDRREGEGPAEPATRRIDVTDRRLDPRSDAAFSLRNLLRLRTARGEYAVTVIGTPDGYVMARAGDGVGAEEAAARASLELFARGGDSPFGRVSRRTPSGRLSGIRFEVEGLPLFVALVDGSDVVGARGREHDRYLDEVAERIQAILLEQRRRVAA